MAKFFIEVEERHSTTYAFEADSAEEALAEFRQGSWDNQEYIEQEYIEIIEGCPVKVKDAGLRLALETTY